MKRSLISFGAAALVLGGSLVAAAGPSSVSAAPPPDQRPTLKELFEIRWGGPQDPTFVVFPNLVTPLTPDGAWICIVPGECLRSTSLDAVEDFNRYLEELERKEKEEQKKEEKNKQNTPTGGGGGGGGAVVGGGIWIIGGGGSSSGDGEERYGKVGPVEQVRDE